MPSVWKASGGVVRWKSSFDVRSGLPEPSVKRLKLVRCKRPSGSNVRAWVIVLKLNVHITESLPSLASDCGVTGGPPTELAQSQSVGWQVP
jgi:hypothetical protein